MVQKKNKDEPEPKPKAAAIELSSLSQKGQEFVTIDGDRYDLLSADQIGLRLTGEIDRLWKRICALEETEGPTDADEAEYKSKLTVLGSIVLPDAPEDVVERQPVSNLKDLAVSFFVLAASKSPRMAMMLRLGKKSTG